MIDWVLLVYLTFQVLTAYGVYSLLQKDQINTRFKRGLAIFMVGATTTLSSVGPLGLILGLPSIVVTSIVMALLLHRREDSKP